MEEKKKKKTAVRGLLWILSVLFVFYAVVFMVLFAEYRRAFGRLDYDSFKSNKAFLYEETDTESYPRECVMIAVPEGEVAAFFYKSPEKKGLILVAPGHTDPNDIKIYEVQSFVDAGYDVVCPDYHGCYNGTGEKGLGGYAGAAHDIDAVLTYVEGMPEYQDTPICLFGHSMGAYAVCASLSMNHRVKKVVAASGFDTPKEQWEYQTSTRARFLTPLVKPANRLFMNLVWGTDQDLSAIAGINSVDIPVLIITGTTDKYYENGISPLYAKRESITNPNCEYLVMDQEGHNDHYGYFLTDAAVKYRKSRPKDPVNRALYMEHDPAFMQQIIDWMEK